MEDTKKTELVKVACRAGNNLSIKRYGALNEGNGFRAVLDAGYTLNGSSGVAGGVGDTEALNAEPGVTMIPREWIEAWLEENKLTTLVAEGFVYIVDDKKPADGEV